MGNIFGGNRNRTGPKKAALDPQDFDAGALVVTIMGKPREFENNGRRRWAIDTVEHPDRVYYVGYEQMKCLTAIVGNDDSAEAWNGQRIALEPRAVKDMSDGAAEDATVPKFYAQDPVKNAATLRAFDAQQAADAAPAATSGGRKRAARKA